MIKPAPDDDQHHHELETLRTLLNLPGEVLDHFEPRQPPKHLMRYVTCAPKAELQWLLVDVLHQLRLRVHQERRQAASKQP